MSDEGGLRASLIRVTCSFMDKPKVAAEHQLIGDKRTLIVYDLDDEATPAEVVDDIVAAGRYLFFAPDTVPEARNRGYRPYKT